MNDQSKINDAKHQSYKDHHKMEKKENGTWLSKEDYEKKTGKPGRV